MTYEGRITAEGGFRSSSLPALGSMNVYASRGLLVRGCVVATYIHEEKRQGINEEVAAYCDVMVYTSLPHDMLRRGNRQLGGNSPFFMLPNVLVSQERGGLHDGSIWKPRAATQDISGGNLDPEGGTNPGNMDGDHVLIGFMDDNLSQAVILRGIPHPKADIGNELRAVGNRMRLKLVDGDPSFRKHHGSFWGVEDDGSFVVDTTRAHGGAFDPGGTEPVPNELDASNGNLKYRLAKGSTQKIEIFQDFDTTPLVIADVEFKEDGFTIRLVTGGVAVQEFKLDPAGKLTIGDGALSAAIGELVRTFLDDVKASYNAHNHGASVSPPTVLISASTDVLSSTLKINTGAEPPPGP